MLIAYLTLAVSAGGVLVALLAVLVGMRAGSKSDRIGLQVQSIEVKVDGRMTQLLDALRENAGLRVGKAFTAGQEQARAAEPPASATQATEILQAVQDAAGAAADAVRTGQVGRPPP